jgi:hypothetical protein
MDYLNWLSPYLPFIFDLKNCRTICSIFLRNNNGKWLMVVNLEKSFSMKNCSMVKKILKIRYTCLKKRFITSIFDLVNFDLLLRAFPSFKMVSFCFNLHRLNFEKKKNVMKLFFRQVYRIFRIFLTIEQFFIENDFSRLTKQ